jgi:hypothetical protein
MFDGKSHVRQRSIEESGPRLSQARGQQLEPLSGQRGEQAAPISEVVRWRGV